MAIPLVPAREMRHRLRLDTLFKFEYPVWGASEQIISFLST